MTFTSPAGPILKLAVVLGAVFALLPAVALAAGPHGAGRGSARVGSAAGSGSGRAGLQGTVGRVPRILPPVRSHHHGRILVAQPRLRGRRVTARVTIMGLRAPVVLEVEVRVIRGDRTVLGLASARQTGNGTSTFSFRLPRSLHRPFRIVASASVVSGATASGGGDVSAGAAR